MTDRPFSDDPRQDDDVASAVLDGVASATETDRVRADPRLAARVESLRQVADRLREPVDVEPQQRERHLAAALAAFTDTPNGSVHSLDEARTRRRAGLVPAMGIAAACAAALVIGLVALTHDRRGADVATSARDTASTAAATVAGATVESSKQVGTEPSTAAADQSSVNPAQDVSSTAAPVPAAAPTAPIGSAAAADSVATTGGSAGYTASAPGDLPAIVGDVLAARGNAEPSATSVANPCPTHAGEPVATLTWQGRPALLFLVPSAGHATRADVVDPASCADLASAPLPG